MSIQWLNKVTSQSVGGKASKLQKLVQIGLNVPNGFVIFSKESLQNGKAIEPFLEALGDGPKAIRSSASVEDGTEYSFAGQFDTFLNVVGQEGIKSSIYNCFLSAKNAQVSSYKTTLKNEGEVNMAVIVQDMVNAEMAGVLFTADPVSGRRDHIIINAVTGLGEKLMAGKTDAQDYTLSHKGKILKRGGELLSDQQLKLLSEESLRVQLNFGYPVDMEWAFDDSGELYWLQARPITKLPSVHFNELDCPVPSHHVVTRGNIGEMMPGAVTPLTWSVFAYAIEHGMRNFYKGMGALPARIGPTHRYIVMYYNHLFMNLTNCYDASRNVWLSEKEDIDFSLAGQKVSESPSPPQTFFLKQFINFVREFFLLRNAPQRLEKLILLEKNFQIPDTEDISLLYSHLSRGREILVEAYSHHYVTSGQSGAYHAMLMRILLKDHKAISPEEHHLLSLLYKHIAGIEGANVIKALEDLTQDIFSNKKFAQKFVGYTPKEAYEWVQKENSSLGKQFQDFLKTHGHRCVREAELSEKSWAQQPEYLIQLLQMQTRHLNRSSQKIVSPESKASENGEEQTIIENINKKLSFVARSIFHWVLPRVREAVARRERSKSLCIKVQYKLKHAYRTLANLLVKRNLLEHEDHIFFLTHSEIKEMIKGSQTSLKKTAETRSGQQSELMKLKFDLIYLGHPEPIEEAKQEIPEAKGNELTGIPVSSGKVRGRVKCIQSLEDAQQIKPNDIMVAAYTDIGWTPYFSLIKGLITEIGSPLSHGAVVAREYGIPVVVSVKGALKRLRDGDEITLDATRGKITIES